MLDVSWAEEQILPFQGSCMEHLFRLNSPLIFVHIKYVVEFVHENRL